LPTWLAWYAHHLPAWWHHLESWGALVLELVVPFFAFGPRALKLVCFAALSAFQLVNLATANYGFFVYLALALHVFLLTDRDITRLAAPLRRQRPPRPTPLLLRAPWADRLRRAGAAAVVATVVGVSAADAISAFVPTPRAWQRLVAPLQARYEPWRLINTYHLFGHITQERIEPEFQLESDGTWQTFDLRHKPGDPRRAPDFVAPPQPRVDFQLWFYGLDFQRAIPAYVAALLDRLCHDPGAVQSLFAAPLPADPEAVRIVFSRYHSSPADEPAAWWTRDPVATTRAVPCRDGAGP
jgi:lipase maturation factor 1